MVSFPMTASTLSYYKLKPRGLFIITGFVYRYCVSVWRAVLLAFLGLLGLFIIICFVFSYILVMSNEIRLLTRVKYVICCSYL